MTNGDDNVFNNVDFDPTEYWPSPGESRAGFINKNSEQKKTTQPPMGENQSDADVFPEKTSPKTLTDAATKLLLIISRITNTATPSKGINIHSLDNLIKEEFNSFDKQIKSLEIDTSTQKNAKRILCLSIDEAILNTPWGFDYWQTNMMTVKYFGDAIKGRYIFEKIETLENNGVEKNHQILTLIYYCLSLGYQGYYRGKKESHDILYKKRESLAKKLRKNVTDQVNLSPHWKGVDNLDFSIMETRPVWLVMALVAGLLTIVFLGFYNFLNSIHSELEKDLANISFKEIDIPTFESNNSRVIQEIPRKETLAEVVEKINKSNNSTILVVDESNGGKTIIRTNGHPSSFKRGDEPSVNVIPPLVNPLEELGKKLHNYGTGEIEIVGHADKDKLSQKTQKEYKDNYKIAARRAESVKRIIAGQLKDTLRPITVSTEGANRPVSTTSTKDEDRRVEIIVNGTRHK